MWDPDYLEYVELATGQRIDAGVQSDSDDEDDSNQEEDSDEEEEDSDDNEEEDEEHQGGDNADRVPRTTSVHAMNNNYGSRVPPAAAPSSPQEVVVVDDTPSEDGGDDECSKPKEGVNGGKGVLTASPESNDDKLLGEFNRGEIDGLFCLICFEAWSNDGDHRVCCLPCGHMFGQSCIKKWLGRQGSNKCPQCKKNCRIKDIRLLYATRVVAVDGALMKKSQLLEAKCASLEKKSTDWGKKEVEWKKREVDLRNQVEYLKERTRDLEGLLEDMERKQSESSASHLNCPGGLAMGVDSSPNFQSGESHKFQMQKEFPIQSARLFGIDSFSKTLVFARRLSGRAGAHVLTNMSLFSTNEWGDIHLDENTKAVKDLHFSPHVSGLVLLASLGKKLSVLSIQSNKIVTTYNLPAAAWSCSWDICSSHYLYAGLQNGTVLQFDTRQTARHVESLTGGTDKLVHSLHSLPFDSSCSSGVRSVISASARGLCQLDFGGSEERPYLIPASDKHGVCISLACSNSSNYITTSFRPKIEAGGDIGVSQPMLTAAAGQTAMGCHVLYSRNGVTYQKLGVSSANVSDIRVPIRSAIIDGVYRNPVFASVDESASEVVFQELPSLMIFDRLKPQNCPIYDVKYSRVLSYGVVGCLSENSFRLYSANLV